MYPISERSARRSVASPVEAAVESASDSTRAQEPPLNSPRDLPRVAPAVTSRVSNVPGETRLVIGLDFGTTYTGVAYTNARGLACGEISLIRNWGRDMLNRDKVPSVISYTWSDSFQQWGDSLQSDSTAMVHKKLELCPQDLRGELDLVVQALEGMKDLNFEAMLHEERKNSILASVCKSPEEIVTDFLRKVFRYLDETVKGFKETYKKQTATDLVVTVPTGWPYEALNSTYRAVIAAGFSKTNFPPLNDVMFITESEAAARYCVRHYKDSLQENFLQENSYFVLCDAGGGTVDLVSYRVLRSFPTLELRQIGKPSGAKCGSIFINQKFKRWLRDEIGDHNYCRIDPEMDMDKAASQASEGPAMRTLMERFNNQKEQFTANHSNDIRINLPFPLDNLEIPGLVNSGELTILRQDMERFFDACLEQIMKMIRHHMRQIEAVASGKPKNLILVGGFGSSNYLKHYIEDTISDYKIRFRTPDTALTAIVQGAVVCGVENALIPSIRRARGCSHSYGISMDEGFQETDHHLGALAQQSNGEYNEKSQLIWFVNEGDVIFANEPRRVKKEFNINFNRREISKILRIYQHSCPKGEGLADRPSRLGNAAGDLSKAMSLRIDLQYLRDCIKGKNLVYTPSDGLYEDVEFRRAVKGRLKSTFHVTLELVLELSWDPLRAWIRWEGHQIATGK